MKGRRITRNRVIKTCQYCYEHKLKCNKEKPCSTCISLDTTDQCIYGFAKLISGSNDPINTSQTAESKSSSEKRVRKTRTLMSDSVIYKSKFSYPFFASAINDKIISANDYNQLEVENVIERNEITNFNRFSSPARNLDDVLFLLPPTKQFAIGQIDTYFDCVHPIIPILDKERIHESLCEVYKSLQSGKNLNAPNILLLMAIFFCSSYVAVASGLIPDLLLCNNYYRAYRYLLDVNEFPMRPLLESLRAFVIVNFVIDPNMVNAAAYSTMLVRIGQQLGLHKNETYHAQDHKLLWNFLLYIEGSSSVVCGFPFFTPSALMSSVPLGDISEDIRYVPSTAYAVGRFDINIVFRQVMELTSRDTLYKSDLIDAEDKIQALYKKICSINNILRGSKSTIADYFVCTLNVFLYRLHLRYYALLCLHSEEDKILQKTNKEITVINPKDIKGILELEQAFREEVIHLSILVLFHTCKRLIQPDINRYVWYTRGSTVMQYLFVVIKDIFQNPKKSYNWVEFSSFVQHTIDPDIRDIIDINSTLYKYVLVEVVLGLMELKLAPLWNNEDLYKFLLVKTVKEKAWSAREAELRDNSIILQKIKKRSLFDIGIRQLQDMRNINLEEYIKTWQPEKIPIDLEKILTNWFMDFHQS